MQQLSKQPAFELGQIVATPGALAALKKAGQQPGEFLTRHVNRELCGITLARDSLDLTVCSAEATPTTHLPLPERRPATPKASRLGRSGGRGK